MRKLLGVLAVAALALGAAQAQATVEAFSGTLSIQLATLTPVPIGGTGMATINGSGPGGHINTLQIPASPFQVTGFVLPVTDPAAAPIAGLQLTVHNGAGAFAGGTGAGNLGGVMPLVGVTKVCLFASCPAPPPANLVVPLNNVGSGGVATVATLVNITAIGAPWTMGTAAVGAVSVNGFKHGAASLTSSTGLLSGNVRLVTPVFVSTNIGASAVVPVFGILDLHFVPEPGTMLLLGSGIAGLVMFGRSKRS
jgi:hypothetical protein